jgi:hypothetical protein
VRREEGTNVDVELVRRRPMVLALTESKACADRRRRADVVELLAVPCYEDLHPHGIFAMDPDISVSVRAVAP